MNIWGRCFATSKLGNHPMNRWLGGHFAPRMELTQFHQHHRLVVWNMNFSFPYIGKIIPTDEVIFFRGVETTNQIKIGNGLWHWVYHIKWFKKVIGGDLTGKKAGINWEYMGAFLVIKADHSQDLIQWWNMFFSIRMSDKYIGIQHGKHGKVRKTVRVWMVLPQFGPDWIDHPSANKGKQREGDLGYPVAICYITIKITCFTSQIIYQRSILHSYVRLPEDIAHRLHRKRELINQYNMRVNPSI